jgi:hypothetical protein
MLGRGLDSDVDLKSINLTIASNQVNSDLYKSLICFADTTIAFNLTAPAETLKEQKLDLAAVIIPDVPLDMNSATMKQLTIRFVWASGGQALVLDNPLMRATLTDYMRFMESIGALPDDSFHKLIFSKDPLNPIEAGRDIVKAKPGSQVALYQPNYSIHQYLLASGLKPDSPYDQGIQKIRYQYARKDILRHEDPSIPYPHFASIELEKMTLSKFYEEVRNLVTYSKDCFAAANMSDFYFPANEKNNVLVIQTGDGGGGFGTETVSLKQFLILMNRLEKETKIGQHSQYKNADEFVRHFILYECIDPENRELNGTWLKTEGIHIAPFLPIHSSFSTGGYISQRMITIREFCKHCASDCFDQEGYGDLSDAELLRILRRAGYFPEDQTKTCSGTENEDFDTYYDPKYFNVELVESDTDGQMVRMQTRFTNPQIRVQVLHSGTTYQGSVFISPKVEHPLQHTMQQALKQSVQFNNLLGDSLPQTEEGFVPYGIDYMVYINDSGKPVVVKVEVNMRHTGADVGASYPMKFKGVLERINSNKAVACGDEHPAIPARIADQFMLDDIDLSVRYPSTEKIAQFLRSHNIPVPNSIHDETQEGVIFAPPISDDQGKVILSLFYWSKNLETLNQLRERVIKALEIDRSSLGIATGFLNE